MQQIQQIQQGGAKKAVIGIIQKYAWPIEMYVMLIQVMAIVYVRLIPSHLAYQASTTLGRIFLFALVITVANIYSWLTALLMGVFAVLLLAVAPRTKEGFVSGSDDVDFKLVDQKKKWFVERALGENPVGIEEDRVRTGSIQDNTNSSNSNSSSK